MNGPWQNTGGPGADTAAPSSCGSRGDSQEGGNALGHPGNAESTGFTARLDGFVVGCGGCALGQDGETGLRRILVQPDMQGWAVGRRTLVLANKHAAIDEQVQGCAWETGVRLPCCWIGSTAAGTITQEQPGVTTPHV